MMHSVRWRLLIYSVLVSAATILAVGVVTSLLISAYFARQERDYLRNQAALFAPTIAEAVASDNPLELQRVVALASFANQTRVQVFDAAGQMVADSGEREDQALFNPLTVEQPELIVGVVVDESGRVVRLSPPVNRGGDSAGSVALSLVEPSQLFDTTPSFGGISETRYRAALRRGSEIVGYMELSEGPAVGEEVMRSIWLALLGGSLVALLIAVAAGLLAARQVTRPLHDLGTAAEAMGAGELSARVPRSGLREYDRLATQFNAMAGHLAAAIERLQQERELLRRTIADASHELRTPLTALKTFNTLLEEEVPPESTAARFVRESEKQIDRLDRLTAGMLDLSRLETRLQGTNFATGDLRETVGEAVRLIRPLSEEKEQTLDLDLPAGALLYEHDAAAMQQAVGNLLHNAVKYTPAGGQISVSLREKDEAIHIQVRDNGIGIPPEIQERIFERFYRAPGQAAEGSGLGLAICREIVAIHNGRLAVDSQPGNGSTFTITLPLKRTPQPTQ